MQWKFNHVLGLDLKRPFILGIVLLATSSCFRVKNPRLSRWNKHDDMEKRLAVPAETRDCPKLVSFQSTRQLNLDASVRPAETEQLPG